MTLRELLGERRLSPPDAKILNASQVKPHTCVHWVLKFPSTANDSVRRPCPPPEEGLDARRCARESSMDRKALRELLGERRRCPPDSKIISASRVKKHKWVH